MGNLLLYTEYIYTPILCVCVYNGGSPAQADPPSIQHTRGSVDTLSPLYYHHHTFKFERCGRGGF